MDSKNRNIAIKIENGNFSWGTDFSDENDNSKIDNLATTQKDEISLATIQISENNILKKEIRTHLKNINLSITKGEFIAIIGEVGAGKSSLVQAILNNMQIVDEAPDKSTRLIINGSVGYVSQIPWIQNNTLRKNILFSKEFDEDKYNNVLNLCELNEDLKTLIAGDLTEIGEKGVNLSGGQKARVAIARAIYNDNEIYIMDDPISALDAHVANNIMKNLLVNHLRTKTRVLITHAIQYLHYCDRIILMKNGNITWEGNYDDLLQQGFYKEFMLNKLKNQYQIEEIKHEEDKNIDHKSNIEETSISINSEVEKMTEKKKQKLGRITKDEDREVGSVKINVYLNYLKLTGGYIVFGGVFIGKFIDN